MIKKAKRLRLKPSARDKRRYFIAKGTNEKIEAAILNYLGVLGFTKSAYMKVDLKNSSGKTIGSCLTKSLNDVRSALALAGIQIEKVSGTLKGLEKK